ncbi:hypothetical protein V8G54_025113 [Vigna mungo]|uniref:Retrotransposon gag domain-containing protein n=1 Tax=Vigna mungo TaxID=3915 RepID=A0AAQ3RRY5_VIGMU
MVIGYKVGGYKKEKKGRREVRPNGIDRKGRTVDKKGKGQTERDHAKRWEAGKDLAKRLKDHQPNCQKVVLVTFHTRIRNNWSDLPDPNGRENCRIVKGGNCRIVKEERKLKNLELSMRGLETKIEAVRKGLQELLRKMEERARQSEENSDGSQAYVNGKKEDRRKEEEGEKIGGGGGGLNGDWKKRVELPIFDGVDPLNWINRADKFFELQGVSEEEKLRLAYISMEGSAGFWFRFWREHTGNRTLTGLKETMVLRFGGRNQGPVFERLATSKQSEIVQEYNQPLNGKELLELNGSNARGLPETNGSRLLDLNVRERAEPKERGHAEPNGKVLREPIGSRLTDSNVRGQLEPNDSGLPNSNVRGLPEPNGSGLTDSNVRERAEPKERGPTEPNGRGRNGRMKVLEGREKGRINALERKMNLVKRWASKKNRGLAVFDTLAEGREQREVLKDIEGHFLTAYDSGKMVTRMLNEEWKTLEEVLPPPKPPDLNWRATTSEYPPDDNTMMKRSQEMKFHSSNLEDKVVLQQGVMIGCKVGGNEKEKKGRREVRPNGIDRKGRLVDKKGKGQTERDQAERWEAGKDLAERLKDHQPNCQKVGLVTFHTRIRNNWYDLPDPNGRENCRIVKEETKLKNMELSMRGLETKIEAVCKGLQELLRKMEERARQSEENSDGSQAYVNGKKEDRRKEEEGEKIGGGGGGLNGDWKKRVKLPIYDGVDPLNWINRADKFFELRGVSEEEKLRLAYISMEGSAGFWFRFWREHTGNRTWTGLKEAMVLRFGGRNQGPVFERLATSKQSGIVEEYNQPLNGKELLEPNGSNARGLPELNGSRLLDLNVRERAERKERGHAEPNGKVLREPIGSRLTDSNVRGPPEPNDSGLTDSNVRGQPEPNDSGLPNSNVRGLPEPNGSGLTDSNVRERAEPKERGPTEPNGRGRSELNVRKLNGRKNEGVGRKENGRINALERKMNLVKRWASKKNRGLAVFDTLAEGREQREVLKDIEGHFLRAYDSGKMVTRMLNEEWKILEEVLPPPKPPDLNWRATTSEYPPDDNTMMKRSQEMKFHSSNLEDKVVLQQGVMIGCKVGGNEKEKKGRREVRPNGIDRKGRLTKGSDQAEWWTIGSDQAERWLCSQCEEVVLVTFHTRIRNKWANQNHLHHEAWQEAVGEKNLKEEIHHFLEEDYPSGYCVGRYQYVEKKTLEILTQPLEEEGPGEGYEHLEQMERMKMSPKKTHLIARAESLSSPEDMSGSLGKRMQKGTLLLREEEDILLIRKHAVKMTSPSDEQEYGHQAKGYEQFQPRKGLRTMRYYQKCDQKHPSQLPMNFDLPWIEKCKLWMYLGIEMIVPSC